MVKLQKQRRKKVYRHNVNRKRLRNKIFSVGKIGCNEIKQQWERNKSVQTNLQQMGLSYDPNLTLGIPSSKRTLKASLSSNPDSSWTVQPETNESRLVISKTKNFVAEELEKDAKAPRVRLLRLPKSHIEWVTYLMDKYGKDYRAMARDKKNFNQETWKQIRAKIRKFKSIPEQYGAFLNERGLQESDSADNDTDDEL